MVQPVDTTAPSRQVWRPGLISAARQTQNLHEGDELARRAADGLAYAPEYPAAGTGDRSFDLCADNGSNITWPTSTADTLTFSPFGISHYEACPVIGANVAELAAKARRVLAERTSHLVEEVLWTGVLDEGTSIETLAGDNRRLASSAGSLIDGSGAPAQQHSGANSGRGQPAGQQAQLPGGRSCAPSSSCSVTIPSRV